MIWNRKQQAVILLAILLIAAFVVLSIDGGQVYADRRNAQNAADTAALAAALARIKEQDYSTAALERAANNGYNNDGITNTVQVVSPPITGPYAGGKEYIQVIITSRVRTNLLGYEQENTVTAVARALTVEPNGTPGYPTNPTIELINGGGPNPSSTPGSGDGVSTELTKIDELLKQTIGASIAYNKPDTMELDETTTIEFLINPSVSPGQLSSEVTGEGVVTADTVDATPRMKAILYAPTEHGDTRAFDIQPLHEDPEQLISGTSTTSWKWHVTALKGGTHKLTLVVYRYIKYDDGDYWREEDAYTSDILVKVSFGQRLASLDWKWILPTLATAILIPAFWRWYDERKKQQKEQVEQVEEKRKSLSLKGSLQRSRSK